MNKRKEALDIVNKFLKELGYDEIKIKTSKHMESDMENEIIYINLKEFYKPNKFDKEVHSFYSNYLKKRKVNEDISMATWAIIHELGHIIASYTYKDLDKRLEEYEILCEALRKKEFNSINDLMQAYSNLSLEQDANKVSLEVYKKHKELILNLDKDLKLLLNN